MIEQKTLENMYLTQRLSMMQIAHRLKCSPNRVVYWMDKYGIKRRSVSDAIYQRHNPLGDPFKIKPVTNRLEAKLLGLGLGLYWGEGTKANKYAVRLGNSDPLLIKQFIIFLVDLFGVNKDHLKFGLQIFSDIEPETALKFWSNQLDIKRTQFYKITVTISGSLGTYRKKSQYGVLTLYYHNKKLRDTLVDMLPR